MEYETANTKKVRHLGKTATYAPEAGGSAGHRLHPMLDLQQQAGNQAVQALLRSGLIRAKLAISQPGDPAEREADQVADRVMRSHAGSPISAPCSCAAGGERCEECQQNQSGTVARKPTSTANTAAPHYGIEHVLRSSGHPLDAATRAFFEPRFGRDFSNVRLHTDGSAAESAQSISALAYAAGPNIAFARGQYQPATVQGKNLLAHELAHVVQQENTRDPLIRRVEDPGQPPMVLSCDIATDSAPGVTDSLLFANNSALLTNENKTKIGAIVEAWKTEGHGATVRVDGFASQPGSNVLNWTLSCERAGAVKDELMGAGIPESSIQVFMHGKTSQFGNEDLNRRVNLFLKGPAPVEPNATPVKPEPEKPPEKTNAQMARDGVVKALKLINAGQDEDSNIVPYDGNNAQVLDPSKIDTTGWESGHSGHASAFQKVVPGYSDLQVKIYYQDKEREGLTTIGLIHTGASHVWDYVWNYNAKDRSNQTNADIARDFCKKVEGGCP